MRAPHRRPFGALTGFIPKSNAGRCSIFLTVFRNETFGTAARESPDALKSVRAFLASGLHYEMLREPINYIALTVADDVTVDPEGYTDVTMAELVPNYGNRGAAIN